MEVSLSCSVDILKAARGFDSSAMPLTFRRFGHAINTDEVFGTHKAEIAALADATLLKTRSMAKSVELGMTMSGARRVR
jgi:hypothetical protein